MNQINHIDIHANVVCDTSFLSIIKVSGEDASAFLQGQFSNDINLLDESNSQLNSYNSPKGRMYASFRILKNETDYLILLPSEISEPVVKRLRMFVMRSKVELEDISDNWTSIGMSGLAVTEIQSFPNAIDQRILDGETHYIRLPGVENRLLIVAAKDNIQSIKQNVSDKFVNASAEHWKRLDIHAGIPNIYQSTQEAFVAQMVNLQLVNGVSFTKGCYPGQEVVARMHYLGKLKKRMYLIKINSEELPTPGDNLYLADNENTQSIGQIVDAQHNDQQSIDALAVIQSNAIEKGNICLGSSDGASIDILDLPYALE